MQYKKTKSVLKLAEVHFDDAFHLLPTFMFVQPDTTHKLSSISTFTQEPGNNNNNKKGCLSMKHTGKAHVIICGLTQQLLFFTVNPYM